MSWISECVISDVSFTYKRGTYLDVYQDEVILSLHLNLEFIMRYDEK